MSFLTGDVLQELVRALFDLALMPARATIYLFERRKLEREARADLACDARLSPLPDLPRREAGRPLVIFVSCAEVSGEKHAANLVDSLRRIERERGAPEPRFLGLGGALLRARGVELVGDPVSRAAMGFDVFSNLPYYLRLLADVARRMDSERPDLFLPVDSPALHVPLGHVARRHRVPVVHFVTPQYWGWAPWRVGGYRRAVDLALCILPFEVPWFERHAVPVAHVGHPLLDELAAVPPGDVDSPLAGPPVIALLPGSRAHVVERNLPWMLRVLDRLRREDPELTAVLPSSDPAHEARIEELVRAAGAEDWVRITNGDLHEELSRARAAFSVSGTILIDLLHRRLPTVVIYRLASARQAWAYRRFLSVPFFASVNLLAGREVLPEFCFHAGDPDEPLEEVGKALERCYKDEGWRAECLEGMNLAAARLGPPGAVERAARHALARIARSDAPSPHA